MILHGHHLVSSTQSGSQTIERTSWLLLKKLIWEVLDLLRVLLSVPRIQDPAVDKVTNDVCDAQSEQNERCEWESTLMWPVHGGCGSCGRGSGAARRGHGSASGEGWIGTLPVKDGPLEY